MATASRTIRKQSELLPGVTARTIRAQQSAVTNGRLLLNVDERCAWVRRARDLIRGYVSDLGGEAMVSTGEMLDFR